MAKRRKKSIPVIRTGRTGSHVLPKRKPEQRTGKVQITRGGNGFLTGADDGGEDIFLPREHLSGVMDGDTVRVELRERTNGRTGREGRVIKIEERAHEKVLGRYCDTDGGYVAPDDRRMGQWINIHGPLPEGVKDGSKVEVTISSWPTAHRPARGAVTALIGHESDSETDLISILYNYSIPVGFSGDAMRQAEALALPEMPLPGREDLRGETIFTVDGADAKDFDDAVSIKKLKNGYELGVHIADVSEYVREGTPLDAEALQRGTSVYLPGLTVPMLPEKLCNGLCSLRPGEDKLTLSVFITFNRIGRPVAVRYAESVIRSCARFTYNEVYGIISGDRELRQKYSAQVPDIDSMAKLAAILRRRRGERGALDFSAPEPYFVFDDDGYPIDIRPRETNAAHQMIEEFMIACNEAVARELTSRGAGTLYRIHERPDKDKLRDFIDFAVSLGYPAPEKGEADSHKYLGRLLEEAAARHDGICVSTLLLRCMQKAKYSPENLGHYGLASDSYLHFTSPIRRYPDITAHRALKRIIHGEKLRVPQDRLTYAANRSSETERRAVDAERDADKLRSLQYLHRHMGETFDGIISGLTGNGMFVQLQNTAEGFVSASMMKGDYYIYNEKLHCLVGERSQKRYTLGDSVKITVMAVSPADRRADFELVQEDVQDAPAPQKKTAKTQKLKPAAKSKSTGYRKTKKVKRKKHA